MVFGYVAIRRYIDPRDTAAAARPISARKPPSDSARFRARRLIYLYSRLNAYPHHVFLPKGYQVSHVGAFALGPVGNAHPNEDREPSHLNLRIRDFIRIAMSTAFLPTSWLVGAMGYSSQPHGWAARRVAPGPESALPTDVDGWRYGARYHGIVRASSARYKTRHAWGDSGGFTSSVPPYCYRFITTAQIK